MNVAFIFAINIHLILGRFSGIYFNITDLATKKLSSLLHDQFVAS